MILRKVIYLLLPAPDYFNHLIFQNFTFMTSLPSSGDVAPAFFQSALTSIHDPIYVFDREHRLVYVNQAMQNLFAGIAITGKTVAELGYPVEICAWSDTYVDQVFETGEPVEDEFFYTTLSGREAYYNFSLSAIKDDAGKVAYVIGISRETTMRRVKENDREALLYGQQQAFRAAMRGQPLQVSLKPLIDAIVLQTNGDARAAFYVIPPCKEGLHLVAGMSEEYAKDVNGFKVGPESPACGLAMHTGEPVITPDIEEEPLWIPFRDMARKHRYRGCWSFPVRTEGGPVLGTLAMYFESPREPRPHELEMADVLAHAAAIIISRDNETRERARAEKALKESREKYCTLFDSIDEGFCLIQLIYDDKGEISDWLFVEANPTFERLSGLQPAGKKISELLPGTEKFWFSFYDSVNKARKPARVENEVAALGKWYNIYASPVNGVPDMLAVIFDDVTQRRQIEAAQRANEERQAFLLKLSDTLRQLSAPAEIQGKAAQLLGEQLGASRVVYVEVTDREYIVRQDYVNGIPSMVGRHAIGDFGPGKLAEYLDGRTRVVNDTRADEYNSSADARNFEAIGVRAGVGVPLLKDGRFVANFVAHMKEPHHWTAHEVGLIEETAERTWAAVERAKAEEGLRNTELTRRMALEAFNIGMTVWYPQEDYTDSDDRFFELFGLNDGDVINRETALSKLLHPEDREYYGDLVIKALDPQGDGSLYAEYRVIYPDGSIHWIATTGQTIFEGQLPVRMYGMVQEITLRKEAENNARRAEEEYRVKLEREVRERTAELNSSRELLRATFDSNPEMIQVFRAVRNKQGTIVDFIWILNNASSEQIYGDVIGKSLLENNPGVMDEGIFAKFVEVVETGIPQQYEKHYVHEQFDGWFFQSVVKMEDGVATNTANITERKKTEQKLRELEVSRQREIVTATLNALEEERRRIAESLHNGLGQLLYAIKISLATLAQEMAPAEFKEAKDYTSHLLGDAITESRRISHELMPATLEEFGLQTAIGDICDQLQDGIHFTCLFKGPKQRLEKYLELAVYRTVQELMTNVIKHARATEARTEVAIGKKQVLIRVTDNGKGFLTVQTHKPGIGLSSIRSKIKLLNGQVDVRTGNNGTEVEVLIPIPQATGKNG